MRPQALVIAFIFIIQFQAWGQESQPEPLQFKIWVWSDATTLQVIDTQTQGSLIFDLYYPKHKHDLDHYEMHKIGDVRGLLAEIPNLYKGTAAFLNFATRVHVDNLLSFNVHGPTSNPHSQLDSNSVFIEATYASKKIADPTAQLLHRWLQTMQKVTLKYENSEINFYRDPQVRCQLLF